MDDPTLRRIQLRHLTRHFFGRFFDSELVATPHCEMHLLFVQMLALLVVPGLFRTIVSVSKYSSLAWFPVMHRDNAVLIDGYFFLCFSMILTGFITVFEWDALFPDHKEYCNLTPLPIDPKVVFFAKVIALSAFVLLFNVAINGISTIIYPGSVYVWSCKPGTAGTTLHTGQGSRHMIVHALCLLLSSLFVFTSLISIRSVFLFSIPAKYGRIVSRCSQLALILVFLCALFIFPGIRVDSMVAEKNRLCYVYPPFWFLGMYKYLLGHNDAIFRELTNLACRAVVSSFAISILSYVITYRAGVLKGFLSAATATYQVTGLKKVWIRLTQKTFLRDSIQRASFHFVEKTVSRRPEHMLYVGSFAAMGLALICLGVFVIKSGYVLHVSHNMNVMMAFAPIMSFFILVGLRMAFSIPADLKANWVFQTVDKKVLERAYTGVYKFMVFAIGAPLIAVFFPLYVVLWDARLAFLHILFVLILSLILIELLLFRYQKLPFTCSYLPGKANIKLFWPAYVLACGLYVYGTTVLERWLLADIRRYALFVVISAVGFVVANVKRSSFLKKICEIRFEEERAEDLNILTIES